MNIQSIYTCTWIHGSWVLVHLQWFFTIWCSCPGARRGAASASGPKFVQPLVEFLEVGEISTRWVATQTCLMFNLTWGDDPIWLTFVQMDWFNHQLVNRFTQKTVPPSLSKAVNAITFSSCKFWFLVFSLEVQCFYNYLNSGLAFFFKLSWAGKLYSSKSSACINHAPFIPILSICFGMC